MTHDRFFRTSSHRTPDPGRDRVATCVTAGVLAMLAGCTVGPNYTRPETPMPESFGAASLADALDTVKADAALSPDPDSPTAIASWWRSLGDPALDSLVARAIEGNRDLRVARLRVREARALRGIEDSRRFPTVDTRASAERSRQSETQGQPGVGQDDQNLFSLGLDASWEIDVFGGIRRGVEASDADLAATIEGERAVLVSLVAEVARNYVELREFQNRRGVSDRSIRVQDDTVDLAQSRLTAGLAAELEVAQARTQAATRRSQRPPLLAGERGSMHRLAVLLGEHPSALVAELAPTGQIPRAGDRIGLGMPSELLRRRPDIRRAERGIAAASARIGIATSDLFPKFSLTGSFGLRSEELDPLLDMSSRQWSIGPSVRWNLFDAGRIRNNIEAASERERQAFASYEQTVLVALEETENALTQLTTEQSRNRALADAVTHARRAVQLADERYRSGIGDFLDVLDSQRLQYDAEDQLVASDATVTQAVIALYKALGGGWGEERATDEKSVSDSEHPQGSPG